jgi:hypothetical protein
MSDAPAHSPYGPSSAERWLKCAASVRATRDLPDTDSEFAIEGTAAHTLATWCQVQDVKAKSFLGHTVPVKLVDDGQRLVEVTQEMVDGVQSFVDYVNSQDFEHALIETRASYLQYVPDGWGTLDRANLRPGWAGISDFKFGKGILKYAKWNEQLLCYALGVLIEWDWLFDFKTFGITIFQPRLRDEPDEWEISREDLIKWAEEKLRPGYLMTLADDATFVPGVEQCQFCKIKGTCKARAQSVFASAIGDFENLDEASATVQTSLVPSADAMTNDEVAVVLGALPNIKAWMKAIEAYAMKEVQQGRAVGDYKLVEGRSNRVWAVSVAEIEQAIRLQNLDEEELYLPREMITPPAAEKIYGKALFGAATTKKAAGSLAHLVKKPTGKPKLAPGSDERPALTIDAMKEFTNLDEEE